MRDSIDLVTFGEEMLDGSGRMTASGSIKAASVSSSSSKGISSSEELLMSSSVSTDSSAGVLISSSSKGLRSSFSISGRNFEDD